MNTPTPRAAVPGVSQPPWSGAYPPDFAAQILSTVVGGAPFSASLTPLPTQRSAIAFGILDAMEPDWIAELDQIPDLAKDQSAYEVAVSKLAGSILISQESIDDTDFPVTAAVSQVLIDTFSAKLDKDLIGAAGPAPVPTGLLAVAASSDGADLELAAVAAKAAIGASGGQPSHIALSPHHLGELEAARDSLGRALYEGAATQFAGLTTVVAVNATEPFVYDATRCWLVTRKDFSADISNQTDSAWSRYANSLRIIGRFGLAIPQPAKACRKLTVAGVVPSAGTAQSRRKAA